MIGLYSPQLPPVPGGVADHTLRLARDLAARGAPVILLGAQGDPDRSAPLPMRLGATPATLPALAQELGLTALFVQYVPFLYARFGVAPALCPALRAVRRAGTSVAVFVHEPYVPFTRLPWLVTGVLQRRQLRCVVRAADRVYAAVPRFAAICRRYRGDDAVALAPIGAALEPSPLGRARAREVLGLADATVAIGVFSPAAAGFRLDWVRGAMAALAGVRAAQWIVFGHGSERLFQGAGVPANVRALGTMTASGVADTARALDLAVAPYHDGLTMRRSAAMTLLAGGVPLVSSTGHLFDPVLGLYAACEADATAFAARVLTLVNDPAARAGMAERAAAARALAPAGRPGGRRRAAQAVADLARHIGAQLIHAVGPAAQLVARRAAKPMQLPTVWSQPGVTRWGRLRDLRASLSAQAVLLHSDLGEHAQRRLFFRRRRCRRITAGVALPERLPEHRRAAARESLGIAGDAIVAASVGPLDDPAIHDCFLRAAASLCHARSRAQLLVAGTTSSPGAAQALLERVRALGLAPRTQLLAPWELTAALDAADIAVHGAASPAWEPVVPVGLLQALASGAAVIAQDGPLVHELVQDGQNALLTPPGEHEILAVALLALADDERRRVRLAGAGAQAARERHDAARMAAEVLAVYREVLAA